jgi:hypothetical protein
MIFVITYLIDWLGEPDFDLVVSHLHDAAVQARTLFIQHHILHINVSPVVELSGTQGCQWGAQLSHPLLFGREKCVH